MTRLRVNFALELVATAPHNVPDNRIVLRNVFGEPIADALLFAPRQLLDGTAGDVYHAVANPQLAPQLPGIVFRALPAG